ncbi:MAG: hypothetical protein AVDCRST_MAG79-2438 [uncultured Thermoleophilia bacterium]|uniref:Uncharacterized protein n=1 Tax=uncultured Thermoleophilia bacterium TaxID=1497501 RepID=A0A6J4UHR7_9ACTN|nr:MAG: hypothetical protein AVDCRST_MAG79-2438 [uncultured Thermoleophilia bacterium]
MDDVAGGDFEGGLERQIPGVVDARRFPDVLRHQLAPRTTWAPSTSRMDGTGDSRLIEETRSTRSRGSRLRGDRTGDVLRGSAWVSRRQVGRRPRALEPSRRPRARPSSRWKPCPEPRSEDGRATRCARRGATAAARVEP